MRSVMKVSERINGRVSKLFLKWETRNTIIHFIHNCNINYNNWISKRFVVIKLNKLEHDIFELSHCIHRYL